ncbi:MAG: DUF3077 domain-containing protein [Candidatus Accumulibacter phosphatis]|nr:DUF3077 domain-containing protein [Candidatus Accumulibacter phosphatis]
MSENTPLPLFSAAGYPADFFVVSEDITTESALDGASMFLDTAISLASNPEELDVNAIFAVRHLAEMAKALVDTVTSRSMEGPRVPIQTAPENPAPRPMRVEEAIGHFLACNKAFSSLEVLLIEIDGSDNLLTQGGLIDTGLGIAKRYADLAQGWRDALKAGGVQS